MVVVGAVVSTLGQTPSLVAARGRTEQQSASPDQASQTPAPGQDTPEGQQPPPDGETPPADGAVPTETPEGSPGPSVPQGPPPPPPILRVIWTSQLPAAPMAPAGFDSTHTFVPLRDQLVAAALADGAVAWTIDLPSPSTPIAGDGQVFLASDEKLLALSPLDGASAWSIALGARLSAPLTWDNGWLFAATENAELFALRARDGQLQWRRTLGSPLRAKAVPAAERVYVALEDGRVAALDIHAGETLWERPLGGTPAELLALDDRLFVGSKDNFFYCLDVKSGKVRWRWRTGADIIGAPIVDERHVYFMSLDNVLRALDRRRGGLKWQRGLPMRASSGPIRLEDLLIVPGVAAEFSAFRVQNGFPAGTYRAAADLAAPPHLHVKRLEGAPDPEPSTPATTTAAQDEVQQLIVLTREGGLEALSRAPATPPAAPPPAVPAQTTPAATTPADTPAAPAPTGEEAPPAATDPAPAETIPAPPSA